jgi:hypothetical protein
LLHGQFAEAFHLNALFILALPLAVVWAAICYMRFLSRSPFRWPQPPSFAVYASLGVTALFTVVRNL